MTWKLYLYEKLEDVRVEKNSLYHLISIWTKTSDIFYAFFDRTYWIFENINPVILYLLLFVFI